MRLRAPTRFVFETVVSAVLVLGCFAGCSRPKDINSIGMEFVQIGPGTFTMGTITREASSSNVERPHSVTLSQPLVIGRHEVTQQQYLAVMGSNPSQRKSPLLPVESVSWNEAKEFCRRLSERPEEKNAGYVYRLPYEAEWEYACRATMTSAHSFSDISSTKLADYAWYQANSLNRSHRVGTRLANAFGLYDMHGNVAEWCEDWLGDYPATPVADPRGPKTGVKRVCRGGSFSSQPEQCRSAFRLGYVPERRLTTVGFRVVRDRAQVTLPP